MQFEKLKAQAKQVFDRLPQNDFHDKTL